MQNCIYLSEKMSVEHFIYVGWEWLLGQGTGEDRGGGG
jgi:hypothetical protein